MSTLFLIGNGFDLNCGLKTRYEDVYKEYVKTDSPSDTIEMFKNEIDSNISNWGDFEIAMGKYAKNFNSEADYIACITDFQLFLRSYLLEQEQSFLGSNATIEAHDRIAVEMYKSLSEFYEGETNNIRRQMAQRHAEMIGRMDFVSFNYTSVFDVLTKEMAGKYGLQVADAWHIHGTLSVPTLGVDSEEQILAGFPVTNKTRRSFVKPFFNQEYDNKRIQLTLGLIENADTICTYGTSLGLSDLSWRKALVNWLARSTNRHLFIYDFGLSGKKVTDVPNKMNIEEDAKIDKLAEWGVEYDDGFFDRFHMVCGRNIFNINDVINKN